MDKTERILKVNKAGVEFVFRGDIALTCPRTISLVIGGQASPSRECGSWCPLFERIGKAVKLCEDVTFMVEKVERIEPPIVQMPPPVKPAVQ